MRIIIALTALFVLAGCETMDFTSVTVSSGYNHHYHPPTYISYTLGYYTGSHYNGYRVYGTYGSRYYHAPRGYRHHRHYSRPVVVNNYYTPPRRTPPRHTPPRHTPPRHHNDRDRNHRNDRRDNDRDRNHRNDRREDREDRNDRRRDPKRKRK